MSISKDDLKHLAHLARIELKDSELDKLSIQLKSILDFIDKLSKLDVSRVEPTSHILPINNVLREDNLSVSLPHEKTLKNAPEKNENFFLVPKVIE
jgi:aspartyl-tRNA(Asn)/glutamyl-tRNA(Gln) amidotransferase subunit C